MSIIDPNRYPLLHQVTQGAQLAESAWAGEYEAWLRFIDSQGMLPLYLPRLQGPNERRDEALAEIGVAYFLATKCLRIFEWEPPGAGGKKGDFLVGFDRRQPIFVEVKSPGWEAEIIKVEGQHSPRLMRPKYIHAEARFTNPVAPVRHAVKKAYPKMPSDMPTILVIHDDLMVQLLDWGEDPVDIALYRPRVDGYTTGDLAEDGPFADNRFERLAAVGVLNVVPRSQGTEYRFALFDNPYALVPLPKEIAQDYPRYNGSTSLP